RKICRGYWPQTLASCRAIPSSAKPHGIGSERLKPASLTECRNVTRAELFSAVRSATHRSDASDSQLAEFLLSVESKIARDIRAAEQVTSATLTISDGTAALPADFLEARALSGARGPIPQVGIYEYETTPYETLYAIRGSDIIARRSDGAATLDYYKRMPALEADGDTHALLAAHSDLYVWLLSFHVYTWTQDIELAQGMIDAYNDAAEKINALAARTMGGPRIRRPYYFGSCGGAY